MGGEKIVSFQTENPFKYFPFLVYTAVHMYTMRQVYAGILTFMHLSIGANIFFFFHCHFSFNVTAALTILIFTALYQLSRFM